MSLERVYVTVSLMIVFTVDAFEVIQIQFILFGFQSWQVCLLIHKNSKKKLYNFISSNSCIVEHLSLY